MSSFLTGHNHRLQIALNAITNGESFGGTPGAYSTIRTIKEGFSVEPQRAKEKSPELNMGIRWLHAGGVYFAWTIKVALSYEHREELLSLLFRAAVTTTGAAAPYSNTWTFGTLRQFGSIIGWYSTDDGETLVSETLGDCWATGGTLSIPSKGPLMLELSGIAKSHTLDDGEASLPTITETDHVLASHLTALTVGGVSGLHLTEATVKVSLPCSEDDGFDLAVGETDSLSWIGATEAREITADLAIRSTLAAKTLIGTLSGGIGDVVFTFNNGLTSTAEREFKITLADCEGTAAPFSMAVMGRLLSSLSLQATALNGSEATVVVKNSIKVTP
mgnify:CR=1 FL=1